MKFRSQTSLNEETAPPCGIMKSRIFFWSKVENLTAYSQHDMFVCTHSDDFNRDTCLDYLYEMSSMGIYSFIRINEMLCYGVANLFGGYSPNQHSDFFLIHGLNVQSMHAPRFLKMSNFE